MNFKEESIDIFLWTEALYNMYIPDYKSSLAGTHKTFHGLNQVKYDSILHIALLFGEYCIKS